MRIRQISWDFYFFTYSFLLMCTELRLNIKFRFLFEMLICEVHSIGQPVILPFNNQIGLVTYITTSFLQIEILDITVKCLLEITSWLNLHELDQKLDLQVEQAYCLVHLYCWRFPYVWLAQFTRLRLLNLVLNLCSCIFFLVAHWCKNSVPNLQFLVMNHIQFCQLASLH